MGRGGTYSILLMLLILDGICFFGHPKVKDDQSQGANYHVMYPSTTLQDIVKLFFKLNNVD